MILSNPHTHTEFCDGRNTMEEMVLSAIEHGFVSLGFSPHGRQYFDCPYSLSNEQGYFREFDRLKEKYQGRIRLARGVERDLYSLSDAREYDYTIGSIHYLYAAEGMIPVDGDRALSLKLLNSEFGGDAVRLACAYFRSMAAMVTAVRPTILAHFDLFLKELRQNTDTESSVYRACGADALKAARDAGCILEINTGGMARSNQPLPYPEPWALKLWREMDGQVILSSDCHRAGQIAAYFEEMPAYLKAAGFEKALAISPDEGELFTSYTL